jgi:acyl-CoA synthetase (AMP-forming)/AMP-acid ligase II
MNDPASVLRMRAASTPDAPAYDFVDAAGKRLQALTYGELDRRAAAIAGLLAASTRPGDRVLLAFPAGLDFVAALFGCFYAGRLAVPVALPRGPRSADWARLAAIAQDCGFAAALGDNAARALLESFKPLEGRWLAMENAPKTAPTWEPPAAGAVALLQYTSGSTGTPKGVMVRHAGLVHNAQRVLRQVGPDRSTRSLSWLPHFHDMGLVGGIVMPMVGGFPASLMEPLAFLKRPLGWLRLISSGRYSASGGPSFAFAMCVERFDPEALRGVDLGCWRWAINGAEPINARVAARFIELFAPWGFRADAMSPGYGLAEATLSVTGVYERRPLLTRTVDDGTLAGRTLVGCGRVAPDLTLAVVEPASGRVLGDNEVGEIWVSDASVAAGYWNRPEETAATFGARLAAYPGREFLRTGDLGFLERGELYVTGRLKDLIIIDGRNLDPAEVEARVAAAVGLPATSALVAFTIDHAARSPELVIVIERPFFDAADLVGRVRAAVSELFHLRAERVVVVAPGAIPRTTSGKVRRRDARAALT